MTPKTTPRPLLLVSAGLGVITMAGGCFVSGNLVAPPPCDDAGKPQGCYEPYNPTPYTCADGGKQTSPCAEAPDAGMSDGGDGG